MVGAAGTETKVAVTLFAASIVTVQVPLVLVQAPLHPENRLPAVGEAERTTVLPRVALHVLPQVMTVGVLVTEPLPDLLTVSVKEPRYASPRSMRT